MTLGRLGYTMSKLEIQLATATRCLVFHVPKGSHLETDAAPELGGGGTTFSSTDLIAAALGSCIASSLGPIAIREGLSIEAIKVKVDKSLSDKPKRLEQLTVTITLPSPLSDSQITLFKTTARDCTVHRSIGDSVPIQIHIDAQDGLGP